MSSDKSRLHVVDALRGFAIVSIMLLHNLEHFDFYFSPENLPSWIKALDRNVWEVIFFLFSGKSYAIFSLLFGLTFFIQDQNQLRKGRDFRGRFAWRLILLLGFGFINSAFYEGDILTIYAILGFALIPVARLSTKAVLWIAVFLMFQPYEWFNVINGIIHPDMQLSNPASWQYFGRMGDYIKGNSIIDTWIGNLTNGKLGVYLWTWEVGRVFQTISLFMFGMLAGRKALFTPAENNKKFWIRALVISILSFIPLFILKSSIEHMISPVAIHRPLSTIISSWSNMAFMMILVSGIVLFFHSGVLHRLIHVFTYIGRMSLSNYIIQSLIGSVIYYGFGFGLYAYTGATYCLLIGIVLAILQGMFCYYWFRYFKQGPLEIIWHKATWLGYK